MQKVSCPVCDGDITQEEGMEVSELIECQDCGSELEVTNVAPFELEEAPQADEDWGE